MDVVEAYAILELVPGADISAVKQQFRRLSKRYHPDKHTDDNQDWATQNFRRVKGAYEYLLKMAEAEEHREQQARLQKLRTLAINEEGTLHESVLIELHTGLCLDVGAWGKEPPFYSRLSLKLAAALPKLDIPVYKSDDFDNVHMLKNARPMGRLELLGPPASLTILTKIDAAGQVKISLLGEHRFLEFQWAAP